MSCGLAVLGVPIQSSEVILPCLLSLCLSRCQFNDQLISPKHFVHLAGKSTLKDWKRAIRLGGIMLRYLTLSSFRALSLQLHDPEQAFCLLCSPQDISWKLTLPGQQPAEFLAPWSEGQDSSSCTEVASPRGPGGGRKGLEPCM